MIITKLGHSCLHIESEGVTLLTDPGSWSSIPDNLAVDAVLISHEHGDHIDMETLITVLERNPDATVITHPAVGSLLEKAGIAYVSIEPGTSVEVKGVPIESYGTEHAIIYGSTSPCRNTGFLIADRLFMPGDALHDVPPKPVDILALPTSGPWMKIAEAIDYAKAVHPRVAFPIHDALYTEQVRSGMIPRMFTGHLQEAGIIFEPMDNGQTKEF